MIAARLGTLGVALMVATSFGAQQHFRLPRQTPPELFGSVLIHRNTGPGKTRPVAFSHFSHRVRYTCRVCHFELDFAMKRNGTEITEEANRSGAYCGACHDGRTAFAHTDANCEKCHTGELTPVDVRANTRNLPPSKFGDGVDWSRAIGEGAIHPLTSLTSAEVLTLDTTLLLEAEWSFVPLATFPHAEHVRWLDCANCHPSIFNIKKKTTKHFSMNLNLAGEFCGVCHMRVAFPMDDCKRCHPTMREQP